MPALRTHDENLRPDLLTLKATVRMEATILDAPETPAPVFAFRAFRNAIFGTPQTIHKSPPPVDKQSTSQPPSTTDEEAQVNDHAVQVESLQRNLESSPTKRQGILLTPGTAGGRRKTVTFGEDTQDRRDRVSKRTTRSGLPNTYPGKFPSPWTPRIESVGSKRTPTALTQSFMDVRDRQDDNGAPNLVQSKSTAEWEDVDEEGRVGSITNQSGERDITIDLNKPQSGSGRHWKSKYDRHHSQTKQQVNKIIKYKDLAKSFAKERDEYATKLEEKLKKEKSRVAAMEKDLAELARLVAVSKSTGSSTEEDQEKLVSQLAQQTTKMLKSQHRLDRYENAMSRDQTAGRPSSLGDKPDLSADQKLSELTEEFRRLMTEHKDAKKTIEILQDLQSKLSADLDKTQDDLGESEERRKRQEERFQKKMRRLEDQIARHRLKSEEASNHRRHLEDAIDALKSENLELKRQNRQMQTTAQDENLKEVGRQSIGSRANESRLHQRSTTADYEERIQTMLIDAAMPKNSRSRPENLSMAKKRAENSIQRVKANGQAECLLLQDLNFDGASDSKGALPTPDSSIEHWQIPQDKGQKLKTETFSAPLPLRPRSASFESIDDALPSPEDFSQSGFLSSRMLNIAPSLPKANVVIPSPQAADVKRKSQSLGEKTNINRRSVREEDARIKEEPKKELPADRAAAAKARLQQRKAEKKRQLAMSSDGNKENVL